MRGEAVYEGCGRDGTTGQRLSRNQGVSLWPVRQPTFSLWNFHLKKVSQVLFKV